MPMPMPPPFETHPSFSMRTVLPAMALTLALAGCAPMPKPVPVAPLKDGELAVLVNAKYNHHRVLTGTLANDPRREGMLAKLH